MKLFSLSFIGVTGVVLAGCNLLGMQPPVEVPANDNQPAVTDSDSQSPNPANQPAGAPSDQTETPQVGGTYQDYDPAQVAAAAESGTAVLFFHANWCPTCRAADADITSNLDQLPKGLAIFKTDYDTQNELKKKYGVTYQHTFVQVDADGNLIKKWNGGELAEIVENVEG